MNETVSYSRAAFLDTWSAHDWRHGVQVETLKDLTELTVVTENSTYELTIISASSGEILVRGGRSSRSSPPLVWQEVQWVEAF